MGDETGKEVESSTAKPLYMTKKRARQLGTIMAVMNAEFEKHAEMLDARHAFYDAMMAQAMVKDENGEVVLDEFGRPKFDLSEMNSRDKAIMLRMFEQLENTAMKFAGNNDNGKAAANLADEFRQLREATSGQALDE